MRNAERSVDPKSVIAAPSQGRKRPARAPPASTRSPETASGRRTCRGFNAPYQLERRVRGGPEAEEKMAVEVTDGLFDNLFPEEVEATVERCLSEGMPPPMMARELATAAHVKSERRDV
ncbi:hypothetical protein SASPL_139820 [Salvia splendens]|uniref:Uncharacterized protein n=1 Tax=Salvia splendens TaxID=180675 RepID=A0A8X8WNV7_SALSN|nr:hypothetical protein SASPL_139820 [Salvia splendens]